MDKITIVKNYRNSETLRGVELSEVIRMILFMSRIRIFLHFLAGIGKKLYICKRNRC